MKNLLFSALCLILFSQSLSAQYNFYNWTLYGSISPQKTPVVPDLFINRDIPVDEFRFNLTKVNSEMAIGIRRNFKFSSPFFGSLGVEYSQKEETYSMLFTYPNEPARTQDHYDLLTTRRIITVPVGVGVRLGHLDVMSGLKAQCTMSSGMKGEMTMDIQPAKPKTDAGWYTGVGFNFDRVRIGVTYQAMLSRDGNYLIHNGNSMELMRVPNNVSFNVGISF